MNVVLSTRTFPSKSAAKKFFQEMLSRYVPGQTVVAEDFADLNALLQRHCEYAEKSAGGVESFVVKSTKYGGKCFYVKRTDGSVDDVSYIHCVDAKPPTLDQLYAKAAREAVVPDILAFRDAQYARPPVICAVTGQPVAIEESNIDHYPVPFTDILARFREGCGYEPSFDTISKPQPLQLTAQFTDDDVRRQFREFHNQFTLRVVHRSVPH